MYVNKRSNKKITDKQYRALPSTERRNWKWIHPNDESSYESFDFLTSAAIAYLTDSAMLGGLLGGDFTGGFVGDMLDGDLFD